MIADKQLTLLETTWLEAIEAKVPASEMAKVLEALVPEHLDMAEALAALLLEEQPGSPVEELATAKAIVAAVPVSDELRAKAAKLYEKVYAQKVGQKQFEAILSASGLLSGQSPRRSLRTLDTSLRLAPGTYLANRYDHHVLCVEKYNELFGEFELVDMNGQRQRLEPKALADEMDLVEATDFRVLASHRGEELKKLLAQDAAAVLMGLCMSSGGSIDSDVLKERLVPRYIAAGEWSGWWSKARTAAKRSPHLSLEGRNPVTISYHAGGRTLEEELAQSLADARTPLAQLAVLEQYLRDARDRKLAVQAAFIDPILLSLAKASIAYLANRPADALAAALALDRAKSLGLAIPETLIATPAAVLAKTTKPAQALAGVERGDLWPPALDAMTQRPDAASQLEVLLHLAPANLLDEVTARLSACGKPGVVEQVVAEAYAEPLAHLEMALWLWKGPANPPVNTPGKVEMLSRMLKAMLDLQHDWDASPAHRKAVFQDLRAAFCASDFAAVRVAVSQMSEPVAETIKRQIERCAAALAESAREGMLVIMRESFYNLFVTRERLEAWADPNIIWTSQDSLTRREAELKMVEDVKMLENARAIGAAAAHGDLSENSEWKFALEERDMLRARVAKMQDELSRAHVLHRENVPTEIVGVGSKVSLKNVTSGTEIELTFLGPWDADLQKKILSYQTPIAQQLMGHPIGDVIHLTLDGEEGDYRIERLEVAVQ
jgi:transcription elongation factor GreA